MSTSLLLSRCWPTSTTRQAIPVTTTSPPPREVRWGEARVDEMCVGFIAVTKEGQDLTRPGERDDLMDIFKQHRDGYRQKREEAARKRNRATKSPGSARPSRVLGCVPPRLPGASPEQSCSRLPAPTAFPCFGISVACVLTRTRSGARYDEHKEKGPFGTDRQSRTRNDTLRTTRETVPAER